MKDYEQITLAAMQNFCFLFGSMFLLSVTQASHFAHCLGWITFTINVLVLNLLVGYSHDGISLPKEKLENMVTVSAYSLFFGVFIHLFQQYTPYHDLYVVLFLYLCYKLLEYYIYLRDKQEEKND